MFLMVSGMAKAPVFSNHGCRLNAYETEAMKDLATQANAAPIQTRKSL